MEGRFVFFVPEASILPDVMWAREFFIVDWT